VIESFISIFVQIKNFSSGPPEGYPALKLRFAGGAMRTINIGVDRAPGVFHCCLRYDISYVLPLNAVAAVLVGRIS